MKTAAAPEPVSVTTFVGEAESYAFLARAGLCPPRHALMGLNMPFPAGCPVVLKGIGEELWHKSDHGAIEFLSFDEGAIHTAAATMKERVEAAGFRWLGALVCERIDIARTEGLPTEGFISLSRGEAGWVVLCGFGGLQAEAIAKHAPPLRWPLAVTTPDVALAEFKAHLLGRIWLGKLRGTKALTTEHQLKDFLETLWRLAPLTETEGLTLMELNPVVLDPGGVPRPLDAVGQRGPSPKSRLRPAGDFLAGLKNPRRVALAGVSAKPGGLGRTILANLQRCPTLVGNITIIKPGQPEMLGHPCVPDVAALRDAPVDLLMLALPAPVATQTLMALIAQGGGAEVVGLVSGGIGDGADVTGLGRQLADLLHETRAAGRWTPVVLGPNFLGHWVPAAQLDSSFIPVEKLDPPDPAGGGLVLLSQSGAFLLCRRSRAPQLRFGLGVSLGNQMDVALPDMLNALVTDSSCHAVAAYMEGFGPGHLLATAKAVQQLKQRGVTVLIHRSGFTSAGQAAAASHTGSMAGDCELERALLERAGVKYSESVTAFDAALEWLGAWPSMQPGPVALMSDAGFESVNGSDLLAAGGLQAAELDAAAREKLETVLTHHNLVGLVAPHLPLDLTPMADETVYLESADILLGSAAVLLVGLVPYTKRLHTSPDEAAPFAAALAKLRDAHGKPIAVVVDAGVAYENYRATFRAAGLPVFDRIETALLGLRTLA